MSFTLIPCGSRTPYMLQLPYKFLSFYYKHKLFSLDLSLESLEIGSTRVVIASIRNFTVISRMTKAFRCVKL